MVARGCCLLRDHLSALGGTGPDPGPARLLRGGKGPVSWLDRHLTRSQDLSTARATLLVLPRARGRLTRLLACCHRFSFASSTSTPALSTLSRHCHGTVVDESLEREQLNR